MAERTFLVIAGDAATADAVLGATPSDQLAHVVVLGTTVKNLTDGTRALPADVIKACPSLAPDAEVDVAGPALMDAVKSADIVLMDSSQPSRDLAGWLAARLDLPIVWAIDDLRVVGDELEADRVVLGGSHRMVHRLASGTTAIVLTKPTTPASQQNRASRTAEVGILDVQVGESRVRTLESANASADGVPLNAARIVVSVGRGIGGPDKVELFRQLARMAGAGLGASRVAVDSGWIPFAHQVGQTGTAVAPDVYIAFGISGAIQHLAGMRGSKRIIAVNTDLEAPLCQMADVVIQADANEVAAGVLAGLSGA